MATLARRFVAIGLAHTVRGFPNPTTTDVVLLTMRGIRRTYGMPQRRAGRTDNAGFARSYRCLGTLPRYRRDRALLLVAGAFRRSELVAIDYVSVRWVVHGFVITIPRSKSDQKGRGREVVIPHGRTTTCPVKALETWLSTARITDGPVFWSMYKGGCVGAKRLSPDAVADIVKRRARAAGLDSAPYSGHSLRSRFVTSAAIFGMPTWRIRTQTGHTTDAMVSRYIRSAPLNITYYGCCAILSCEVGGKS